MKAAQLRRTDGRIVKPREMASIGVYELGLPERRGRAACCLGARERVFPADYEKDWLADLLQLFVVEALTGSGATQP